MGLLHKCVEGKLPRGSLIIKALMLVKNAQQVPDFEFIELKHKCV
jgi:hypothetical protein